MGRGGSSRRRRSSCERKKCRSLESWLHEGDTARVVLQGRQTEAWWAGGSEGPAVQVGGKWGHQRGPPAGLLQRQIHVKVTHGARQPTVTPDDSVLPVEQLL